MPSVLTDATARPGALPDEHDILGYNIMLAAGLMSAGSNALLRAEVNITMRQYIALRHLRSHPDLGSAELARRLFITPQSTSTLLDGLDRLRYIARAGNNQPGQKMAVRLTVRGRAVVEQGDGLILGLEEEHRERMGPRNASALNALLLKLLKTLHDDRGG